MSSILPLGSLTTLLAVSLAMTPATSPGRLAWEDRGPYPPGGKTKSRKKDKAKKKAKQLQRRKSKK